MPQEITSEDLKDVLLVLQEIAMNQAVLEGCLKLLEAEENNDLVIRILKAYLQQEPEKKLVHMISLLNHLKLLMSMDEISKS